MTRVLLISVVLTLNSFAVAAQAVIRNEVKGLTLYMYDTSPTDSLRKPTLSLEAKRATRIDNGKRWSLSGTRAIVHNDTGETVQIEAAECEFDEVQGIARLWGGVRIVAGDLLIEMEEVEWNNEAGEARCNGPAVVKSGASVLNTAGLVVKPKEEKIVCRNTRGRISFDEVKP